MTRNPVKTGVGRLDRRYTVNVSWQPINLFRLSHLTQSGKGDPAVIAPVSVRNESGFRGRPCQVPEGTHPALCPLCSRSVVGSEEYNRLVSAPFVPKNGIAERGPILTETIANSGSTNLIVDSSIKSPAGSVLTIRGEPCESGLGRLRTNVAQAYRPLAGPKAGKAP
jgi:hypothetical protein